MAKDAHGHGSESRGGAMLRAAHQAGVHALARVGAEVKGFAQNESGEGKMLIPHSLHDVAEEIMKEPSIWIHAGHFFGTLAGIAVIPAIYYLVMPAW